MVVGKVVSGMTMSAGLISNNAYETYEIRSGMTVQDLKQLTAQRTQRQRMEFWEQQARNSPRPRIGSGEWSYSMSSTMSTASTASSSSTSSSTSESPSRYYGNNVNSYHYTKHTVQRYHSWNAPMSNSSFSSSTGSLGTVFVTCGGQVVSFMDGVVNAPQQDVLPAL